MVNLAKLTQVSRLPPLEIQCQAAKALSDRQRLIALLPTGAGKTLLAALPFAAGLLVPKQMVFMTPLRSLSHSQANTLRHDIRADEAKESLGTGSWCVSEQTGAVPEDPEFTSPVVVCTFDQALSSALSIAYSASRRRRGINAGAVLSSYLVADELHLFPQNEALTTLIWLLKHRPELPFTLMTATLSRPIATHLSELLGAELLDFGISTSDRERLRLTDQNRRVRWQGEPLDATAIARQAKAAASGRVIVVVNTVKRAQELGRALIDELGSERTLVLHSRFYQQDREVIEKQLNSTAWMGKGQGDSDGPRVLVATQVIEAGLDISANHFFTEWAPANALVQRWGRCARWGGNGSVTVAPPPDDTLSNGLPTPYAMEEALREPLELTRSWLRKHAGEWLDMTSDAEEAFLGFAHEVADEAWVHKLEDALHGRSGTIADVIQHGLYSHAGDLIRRVNNRTVLLHGEPDDVTHPWSYQGFSLAPGTLLRHVKQQTSETEESDEGDILSFDLPSDDWYLKRPALDDKAEQGQRFSKVVSRWLPVESGREVIENPLFVLNPRFASYDPKLGLNLDEHGDGPYQTWSRVAESDHDARRFAPYVRETYTEHIERMLAVLRQHASLWPAVQPVAPLIEESCGWPAGMLERLIKAAIVLHDAGKLTDRWQDAIRDYQRRAGKPVEEWLVHTDQTKGVDLLDQGPHALSGAAHSLALGQALAAEVLEFRGAIDSELYDDTAMPSRILFTAIATHHGAEPTNSGVTALTGAELLEQDARDHLAQVLNAAGLPSVIAQPVAGQSLVGSLVIVASLGWEGEMAEYVALTVVSRILRLADGWSQER